MFYPLLKLSFASVSIFSFSQSKVFSYFYSDEFFDLRTCFLVPDLVITTSLADLNVKLTTEFYRLLRGFLSMNLGDPLVVRSETIPIEVLQKPGELHASFHLKFVCHFRIYFFKLIVMNSFSSCWKSMLNRFCFGISFGNNSIIFQEIVGISNKYASFSFRMTLTNVEVCA